MALTLPLAGAIYLNFFRHHYVADLRVVQFAAPTLLFGRTVVHFKVWHVHRPMPLLVGFGLVSLFIWFAENIGTGARVWLYPNQGGRLVAGLGGQARLVVPLDDRVLRPCHACEPA